MSTMSAERTEAVHIMGLINCSDPTLVKAAIISMLCDKHKIHHTPMYSDEAIIKIQLICEGLEEALEIPMPSPRSYLPGCKLCDYISETDKELIDHINEKHKPRARPDVATQGFCDREGT